MTTRDPIEPAKLTRARHRVGYVAMDASCFYCTAGPGESCRNEPDKRGKPNPVEPTPEELIEAWLIRGVDLTGPEQAWLSRDLHARDAAHARIVEELRGELDHFKAAWEERWIAAENQHAERLVAEAENTRLRGALDSSRRLVSRLFANTRAVTKAIELAEARMQKRCADVAQDFGGHIGQAIADRINALQPEDYAAPPPEGIPMSDETWHLCRHDILLSNCSSCLGEDLDTARRLLEEAARRRHVVFPYFEGQRACVCVGCEDVRAFLQASPSAPPAPPTKEPSSPAEDAKKGSSIRAAAFREAARLFDPGHWACHELNKMATKEDGIAVDGFPVGPPGEPPKACVACGGSGHGQSYDMNPPAYDPCSSCAGTGRMGGRETP